MCYPLVEVSIPAMLCVSEDDGVISVCATLSITPATAVTNRAITVSLATSEERSNLLNLLHQGLQ